MVIKYGDKMTESVSSKYSSSKYIKPPLLRFLLMIFFIFFLAICPLIDWPMGPAHLSWGAHILGWGLYVVFIVSSFYMVYIDNKRDKEAGEL